MGAFTYVNAVPPKDLSLDMAVFSMRAVAPGMGTCGSYTPAGGCTGGSGSILIIGDSITNQLPQSYSASGQNLLFFSVNGMSAHDVIPQAENLVAMSRPRVIVIALGKNDTLIDPNFPYFQQDYYYLIQYFINACTAGGMAVNPVLMTILPPERPAPSPWSDLTKLAQYNQYIKDCATRFSLNCVDFAAAYSGIDPIVTDGPYLMAGFTNPADGLYIHPIGSANAKLWAYYRKAVGLGLDQISVSHSEVQPPLIP